MVLNIDFGNFPQDFSELKDKLSAISLMKIPDFAGYTENIPELKAKLAKFLDKKNIIVIGNGGSDNNFILLYETLAKFTTDKDVFIINTMDPDYINYVRSKCSIQDTVVIPVSKSGTNVDCLEALFAFENYLWAPVTGNKGVLIEISEKRGLTVISHPDIGGRFSGLTSCALAPAILLGIDVNKIIEGAKKMYGKCSPSMDIEENPALKLSSCLYLLEKQGYSEVFMPFYSVKLSGAIPLIVQLMHESVCKNNKGQTFYGALAPESQHHTNQRFFGGQRNVAGLFVIQKQYTNDITIVIDNSLKDIRLRDSSLAVLNNIRLSKSLYFDFFGVKKHAEELKIPFAAIETENVDEETVGEMIALWQYMAVYSSILRDADPFDQPEVEHSKEISFRMRKERSEL